MFRVWIAIVMLVLSATGCAVKESQPVISQSVPAVKTLKLADIPVHDPWILAHQETQTYYLYTSAGRRDTGDGRSGVKVYKSKDLQNWQGPYIVYRVPAGIWANPAHGVWAPEVHFYNGRYYLFITLHNRDKIIDNPPASWRTTHMRGTVVLVGDSPEGPFEQMQDRPHPPADFMTLDGTLYIEAGVPWMVYCHEWIQTIDGTMEAVQLKPDLSAAVGEPIHLFKASDAPWLNAGAKVSKEPRSYVTDGPFLFKTKTGKLLMLWSSYDNGSYVETVARSESGKLAGPWVQLEPIIGGDSGHGMLFHTFDAKLMLILHQPFRMPLSRAKLYEMKDTGDTVKIKTAMQ